MAESIHPLNHKECCMCGDFGLPNALFRCRTCLFRSQHKYCSDLYPKAESYRFCNWCLRDRGRKPTPITEDNPSANNGISNNGDGGKVCMKRKFIGFDRRLSVHMHSIKKNRFMEINANKYPEGEMKTEVDGDHGMEMMVRKGGGKQELLRTKSEDLSNAKGGMMRQIGRGKVRRYKLLEEVSS